MKGWVRRDGEPCWAVCWIIDGTECHLRKKGMQEEGEQPHLKRHAPLRIFSFHEHNLRSRARVVRETRVASESGSLSDVRIPGLLAAPIPSHPLPLSSRHRNSTCTSEPTPCGYLGFRDIFFRLPSPSELSWPICTGCLAGDVRLLAHLDERVSISKMAK